MSEEMGESEDCSQLVVSGGEELREMAPSSLDRMDIDDEEEVVNGAERSAELSPLAEDTKRHFENPLLERSSRHPLLLRRYCLDEEETAFPKSAVRGNFAMQQRFLRSCLL